MLVTNVICLNQPKLLIRCKPKISQGKMTTLMSVLALRLDIMLKKFLQCLVRRLLKRQLIKVKHLRERNIKNLEEVLCVLKASASSTLTWMVE